MNHVRARGFLEASYNGELIVKLWFEDQSKSLVVAAMPHAQAVNEGMNRHTDLMRAELIHKGYAIIIINIRLGRVRVPIQRAHCEGQCHVDL